MNAAVVRRRRFLRVRSVMVAFVLELESEAGLGSPLVLKVILCWGVTLINLESSRTKCEADVISGPECEAVIPMRLLKRHGLSSNNTNLI
jgi:hypothetical protein